MRNFDFSKRLDVIDGIKVLCVGDLMLDRFIYGEVERISPEGPIPVLRVEREKTMLGGAGNVAGNLAALGAKAYISAVIGDDEAGATVRTRLQDQGINDTGLVVLSKRPTTLKARYLAANQQLLRADYEDTAALAEKTETDILAVVTKHLENVKALIVSDYGKSVIGTAVAEKIIMAANAAGVPTVVDPKGTDFSKYRGAFVITPNKKELAEATGLPTASDQDVEVACQKIIIDCGIEAVVATRSAEGMTIVQSGQEPVHLKTEAREVYDVSGAGDTVVSAIAAALASGADLVEAAALANVAAGLAVEKLGTAVVKAQEIRDALRQTEKLEQIGEGKGHAYVMDRDTAVEQAERWRAKGFKIGFTNGCFDILHPGHISLLSQARERCDRLIVAMNADMSPHFRTKGPNRPVNDENARATVLRSISSVDMVILFDSETPLDLIEAISPDVLVKGADYTEETVVGADHVKSYGGKVFLAELSEGFSTTNTIEKLAAGS